MRLGKILTHRFRSLFRRADVDTELEREIQLHIEQLTRENIAAGMSASEARLAARRAFGSVDAAAEQCRDTRQIKLIEETWKDLSYAFRLLKKSPGFTATAVLSLALGIGANTAIFSFVQKVILELLPIRDPQSLVRVGRRTLTSPDANSFSYPFFRDLQTAANLPFDGFLGYASGMGRATMLADSEAEPVATELISGNYFDVLGVRPALGRLLTADDSATPGAHAVAVLSYNFWNRRFGADSSVLNRTIRLNGHPFTIVGVSAQGFDSLNPGSSPDLRLPVTMEKELGYSSAPGSVLTVRGDQWLEIFGRLKPGVTYAQAADALQLVLLRNHELSDPPNSEYWRRHRASERMQVFPGAQGTSRTRNRFERALWALTAIVGVVLLLAIVNIAHLLLARASAREREFSVRAAVGAGRGRLIRQLLAESILLALLGGALGLALAQGLSAIVVNMVVFDRLHSTLNLAPNPGLLAFNFGVALIAGVLFGLVPALQASRPSLVPGLKGAHSGRGGRLTGRKLLISFQVAMSLVLLVGASLFLRTIQSLKELDLGFQPEKVVQFGLDPVGYPPEQVYPFYERVRERIASIPGVRAAAVSRQRLVGGGRWGSGINIQGLTVRQDEPAPDRDAVSGGYFAALAMPLIAGREFTGSDHTTSAKVAIVNQTFARHYFGNENPLGKLIGPGGEPPAHTIVGIVKDAKYAHLREQTPRFWYVPYTQLNPSKFHALTLSVRTNGDPKAMMNAIQREVATVDKNIAIFGVNTLEGQIDENMMLERLLASLSVFFGGVAAILAAIGLFGVLSYSVSQREREIGIRMALGAKPGEAAWTIVRDVAIFVAFGLAAGLTAALALSHLVETFLFGIKARDPLSVVAASAAMAAVAAIAALLPARRAARTEPAVAFRAE